MAANDLVPVERIQQSIYLIRSRRIIIGVRSGEALMAINDKAPEFSLLDQDGNHVSLKDFKGQTVVLFFYPKANTPG